MKEISAMTEKSQHDLAMFDQTSQSFLCKNSSEPTPAAAAADDDDDE